MRNDKECYYPQCRSVHQLKQSYGAILSPVVPSQIIATDQEDEIRKITVFTVWIGEPGCK